MSSCILLCCCLIIFFTSFFFFIDPAPTEIYTLSLHDALPISGALDVGAGILVCRFRSTTIVAFAHFGRTHFWRYPDKVRSEEHTSELQSRLHLVCRLLLEKKKKKNIKIII